MALGGKKSGAGYVARCPAHNDKNPSLTLSDTKDGRVLFKCQAGCSQEAVMDALRDRGLLGSSGGSTRPQGEWLREMTAKANGHAEPEAEETWGPWQTIDPPYSYTDATGELLFQVTRMERFNAAAPGRQWRLDRDTGASARALPLARLSGTP
jgi:hypothetical protein